MEKLLVSALENFTLLGPDGQRTERTDLVQFVSPAIAHGAMNAVVRARFSTGELDWKIDETLAPYLEQNLNCWWILGPNSTNHRALEAALHTRGFQLEHDACGLLLPTSHEINPKTSPKVTAEKITAATLSDYLYAAQDGKPPSSAYQKYFSWLMEKHGDRLEVFLSRVDGEPAGTGVLQYLGAGANFVSGFVRPRFRGVGAYQALVKFRLERLRARQVPYAVVLAKAHTSAPILMRHGFTKVCEFRTLERAGK